MSQPLWRQSWDRPSRGEHHLRFVGAEDHKAVFGGAGTAVVSTGGGVPSGVMLFQRLT